MGSMYSNSKHGMRENPRKNGFRFCITFFLSLARTLSQFFFSYFVCETEKYSQIVVHTIYVSMQGFVRCISLILFLYVYDDGEVVRGF